MGERKKYHRGRRKKKKGGIISTLILIIAIAVFCVSGYQLYKIFGGYHQGKSEYDKVREVAVHGDDKDEDEFVVDFDELKKINADTVGWIRFYPEPSQISYPLVQTTDNDLYLNRTFSANENTVGAIFVNCDNAADFSDRNTIIYGHRMMDHSMFHDLEKYKDESFWKENPYFYIYTPDGREIKYQIYSAGVVKDTSESYTYQFENDASFELFLQITKSISNYDTGVNPGVDAEVVTLSTCTKDDNDDRFVVHGVKVEEN